MILSKERIVGMMIGLLLAIGVIWFGKAFSQPKLAVLSVFFPVAGVFVGDYIRSRKAAKNK